MFQCIVIHYIFYFVAYYKFIHLLQLEQYKDEVYRLDAAKEDYRVKYDFCSKDVAELTEKVISLF